VDTDTGYRIYEAHQLPRLHRIVALKDLGFTLEQLRPLLDRVSAEVTPEDSSSDSQEAG
jgi:DNA-binding transcriptional MerR regulator